MRHRAFTGHYRWGMQGEADQEVQDGDEQYAVRGGVEWRQAEWL